MLPHELLEVKVGKHSEADMRLDSGFFLIHADLAKKELVAEFYDGQPGKGNGAKLKHIFRGKEGMSIYREIAKRELIKLPDHLAYLGYELARAEACLKEGKRFVQDEEIEAESQSISEKIIIDNKFIEEWHLKYDRIVHDEQEYQKILKTVQEDVSRNDTISKNTFFEIYNWKAPRARGRVKWDDYHIYEEGFKKALHIQDDDKKVEILDTLPGIGIPVASTILHFIYPERVPIVDFRTIEVLQKAEELAKLSLFHFRDTVEGYHAFRDSINRIFQNQNHAWTLRQIDRALFAFHKIMMTKNNGV